VPVCLSVSVWHILCLPACPLTSLSTVVAVMTSWRLSRALFYLAAAFIVLPSSRRPCCEWRNRNYSERQP